VLKTATMKLPVRKPLSFLCFLLAGVLASAKDQPSQVVLWPETGTAVLRFTFGKFKEIASVGNRRSYMVDTTAENLLGESDPDCELFHLLV